MTETKNNKKQKGTGFFSRSLLLILSFIIAIILWYMGTTHDQTPISRIYSDIPVKFINEETLSELSLTAAELSDVKVDAVLKGYYSDMNEIKESELVAVIDLSEQKYAGEYTLTPVIMGCPANVSVSKIDDVDIKIEKLITKELNIELETKGIPANGYYVDTPNIVYPKNVSITCGESISKNVVGAKVVIDVTDRYASFTVSLNIVLIDEQGNEVDTSRIKLKYYSINVDVPVLQYTAGSQDQGSEV